MTIFGNAWGPRQRPVTSHNQDFVAIYPGGLEASGDILGRHLLLESLPDWLSKFLCVLEVSLRVGLI